jgi:hypothetical protein
MGGRRVSWARRASRHTLVMLLASGATPGCDEGAPARPVFVSLSSPSASVGADAGVVIHYAVCPEGMDASFSSLFTKMFATTGCGTNDQSCHSTIGAAPIAEGGTGSLLNFTEDAHAVYLELLGPDGGGAVASNVQGNVPGLRVAPGDADASLLYIKLAMPLTSCPAYGEAMPPTGLPCPPVLDAVQSWIDLGAPEN